MKDCHTCRLRKSLLATAIAATLTPHASASDFQVEEVIVTAQKRTQNVQDVPIAINAFSETMLKERGITDTSELAAQTPSLQYGETAGATQLSIRGVGFGLFTGAGENSVAVHSDGLYIANPAAIGLLGTDFNSVEVLKGPQGTLWGRNATAGAINFLTARPDDVQSGSFSAGYGKYNQKELKAIANLPVNDSLRTRFELSTSRRDGYVDAPNLSNDLLGHDKVRGRFSSDWDVSDSLSSSLRLFYAKQDLDGPFFDPIDDRILDDPRNAAVFAKTYDSDPYKTLITEATTQEDTLKGGSLRFDYDINDDISLASITGLVDFDRDQRAVDTDGTSIPSVKVDRPSTDKTLSQEFNLSGNSGSVDWLLGAYFLKQTITAKQNASTPFSSIAAPVQADAIGIPLGGNNYGVINTFSLDFEEEVESVAFFTDGTYHINDDVRSFAGIRWMQEERDATFSNVYNTTVWSGSNGSFTNTGQLLSIQECDNLKTSQKVSNTTGRLGLQWDMSDHIMTYAQVSTGFKSGGHSTSSCNDDFEPEELKAAEVGFKSTVLDGQAQVNGAIFAYDYTNFQVEEIIGNGAQVNNADAKILGAEIDFLYNINANWEVNGGLTLLDAKYTEFKNRDTINDINRVVRDLSDNPLPRSPDWSATLGIAYTHDLGMNGTLIARTDMSFSDAYQLREFNHSEDQQDSYSLYNASINYYSPDERWAVRVWVKNITNEEVLYGLIDGNIGSPTQGWASGTWNEPRTYGVNVEYHF